MGELILFCFILIFAAGSFIGASMGNLLMGWGIALAIIAAIIFAVIFVKYLRGDK